MATSTRSPDLHSSQPIAAASGANALVGPEQRKAGCIWHNLPKKKITKMKRILGHIFLIKCVDKMGRCHAAMRVTTPSEIRQGLHSAKASLQKKRYSLAVSCRAVLLLVSQLGHNEDIVLQTLQTQQTNSYKWTVNST